MLRPSEKKKKTKANQKWETSAAGVEPSPGPCPVRRLQGPQEPTGVRQRKGKTRTGLMRDKVGFTFLCRINDSVLYSHRVPRGP